MKKYDLLFLAFGTFLSLFPIYAFFGWSYIWNNYFELSPLEKIITFQELFLLNLFHGRYSSALFIISCGLVAGIFLFISLLNSIYRKDKFLKIIKMILFFINGLFTFWIIFGLM